MTEVITEDTPDDGEEMWQYKLAAMKNHCDILKHKNTKANDYISYLKRHIKDLDEEINKLTDNMTIRQLRKAGAVVTIHFRDDCEDDDD